MTDRQQSRDAGSTIPAFGRPWLAAAFARVGGTFRGQGFGVAAAEQAPRRDEVLLDIDDFQLSHQTELRWNSNEDRAWSGCPVREPLIRQEEFDQVQTLLGSRGRTRAGEHTVHGARRRYLSGSHRVLPARSQDTGASS